MSGQGKNDGPENRPNQYQNITTENLSQAAVSYGGDATVNITQNFVAPKPPRPNYINMAPDLKHFVERPKEYNQLRQKLVSPEGDTVVISAALRGAGGFGKTTLAQRLCYDETVQQAFPDGILWVELGEHPDNLVGKVNDLTDVLTGGRPTVVELNAAAAELAHALGEKRCLMVIDDLWNHAHAMPFLRGGSNCTRLITTRNAETLPVGVEAINVDAMRHNEALAMLVRELTGWELLAESFAGMVTRLGEWPLLLKLANRAIYRRVEQQGLEKALAYVDKALNKRGLSAFDAKNPESRGQAVASTMGVSLAELNDDEQKRFQELAVFPEDSDVPLAAVTTLWNATGNLDDFDTEELCSILYDRSLLLRYDGLTLRLHDIVRQYLINLLADQVPTLHRQLLDAYIKEENWANGPNDGYYFQQLAYHLIEAGETAKLLILLINYEWLWTKLNATDINKLLADFQILGSIEPAFKQLEDPLNLVESALRLSSHILVRDKKQLAGQLRGRLLSCENEYIKRLCSAADEWKNGVWLSPMQPCLDPPGGPLLKTLSGHKSTVNDVAITPDGKLIVSASSDRSIRVWNLDAGTEERVFEGHKGWVQAVALTPDGRRAVSASQDHTLVVWNLISGVKERTLEGHLDPVQTVAIMMNKSLDTLQAVSASYGTLKVWNLETGTEEWAFEGHSAWVNAVTIAPNGRWMVSASDDGKLKIWDLVAKTKKRTITGHLGRVLAVAITPDSHHIVSASHDKTLKIWDIETGLENHSLEGHSGGVNAVAITPDGRQILSASDDETLKVWDFKSGAELRTLVGHSERVNAVVITPDGRHIISGSDDKTLKVWDLQATTDGMHLKGHSNWVLDVALTQDGNRVISSSSDETLKVWNLKTGEEEKVIEKPSELIQTIAFTGNRRISGCRVVSATHDGTLKVWDLETGNVEQTLSGHSDRISAVVVTPDGRRLVSASHDGFLKVWNLDNGKEERTLIAHADWVMAVALTPDGKLAVSASYYGTLKVWDLLSGKVKQTLAISEIILALLVVKMPFGDQWVISASSKGKIRIWNIETGKEERMFSGHLAMVNSVVVTPDCRWVISASSDRALKVWEMSTGEEKFTYDLDQSPTCIALTADGVTLVVGDEAGHIFWFTLRTLLS